MSDDFPWPRKGDSLFGEAADWWHNASVGWSREEWFGYAEGYKRAADLLVQHVLETQSDQDFLVYPIGFLYRQSFEIALKHLLIKGRQLLDRTEPVQTHHRLLDLWAQCRDAIEEVWPGGPKEDLDAAEEVIRQFDRKDPRSTTFRYPVDTAGRASLPASERINLRNLGEVAGRAYALLEACNCGISEYLQNKFEMEGEGY